ncbi:MAG: FHA domain-containing protein [Peptococcaceae bacterium]|jgi:serine/threonine protein kinase|nr:FHA domain-containing protein [Peptococcaceae bacterium]
MTIVCLTLCPKCFQMDYRGGQCPQCGYNAMETLESAMTLPPGTLLSRRYITGQVLGIGGFGITYLAMDTGAGATCAIKEYFPAALATRSGEGGGVAINGKSSREPFLHGIKVFQNEVSLLRGFQGEPLIVQARDYFEENGTAYFAMEYLDGVSLMGLARSGGNFIPYGFAKEILLKAGEALAKVHQKNLLHRDVSPENIFITREGQVKLIDFGATRYFVGEMSKSLSVVLKPGFAPPEQYSSRGNQGPWTDIYALAATFYYVLTGVKVPEAPDRLSGKAVEKLTAMIPGLDHRVAEAVDKALRLNYKERYQTVDEFLREIQKGLPSAPGQGGSVPGPGGIMPGPSPKRDGQLPGSGQAPRPGRSAQPRPKQSGPELGGKPPERGGQATGQSGQGGARSRRAPGQEAGLAAGRPSGQPSSAGQAAGLAAAGLPAGLAAAVRDNPYLLVVSGGFQGNKWAVPKNMEIVIGRSAEFSNIVLGDTNISRKHCSIRYDERERCFFVTDCSSNGTFDPAGRRYEKGVPQAVRPGGQFYLQGKNLMIKVGLE